MFAIEESITGDGLLNISYPRMVPKAKLETISQFFFQPVMTSLSLSIHFIITNIVLRTNQCIPCEQRLFYISVSSMPFFYTEKAYVPYEKALLS